MANRKSYSEKLKDPRWQKKRLEILSRDGFTCRFCDDTTTTLHVHHTKYSKGKDPWDYPDFMLITICETCHECDHAYREEYESELLESLRIYGFSIHDMERLQAVISHNDHEKLIQKLFGGLSLVCYEGSPVMPAIIQHVDQKFDKVVNG